MRTILDEANEILDTMKQVYKGNSTYAIDETNDILDEFSADVEYEECLHVLTDENVTPLEEAEIQLAEASLRCEMQKALLLLRKNMIIGFKKKKAMQARDARFKNIQEGPSLDEIIDSMSKDANSPYWYANQESDVSTKPDVENVKKSTAPWKTYVKRSDGIEENDTVAVEKEAEPEPTLDVVSDFFFKS